MYKTANFSLSEVVNGTQDFPDELTPVGMYLMGMLQTLRDGFSEEVGVDVPVSIRSGYRSREYNATLPGASPNSHHIWKVNPDGTFVCAVDTSVPEQYLDPWFNYCAKTIHGEVYRHRRFNFVHIAPEQLYDETFSI